MRRLHVRRAGTHDSSVRQERMARRQYFTSRCVVHLQAPVLMPFGPKRESIHQSSTAFLNIPGTICPAHSQTSVCFEDTGLIASARSRSSLRDYSGVSQYSHFTLHTASYTHHQKNSRTQKKPNHRGETWWVGLTSCDMPIIQVSGSAAHVT